MENNVVTILWNRRIHQDNLIHTRFNWLLLTQSFLLAAFFSAYDKINPCRPIPLSISMLGFLSTLLVYISIIRGISAYCKIRNSLWDFIYRLQDVKEMYLAILQDRSWSGIKWRGFLPCLLVPPLFVVFWVALFISFAFPLDFVWVSIISFVIVYIVVLVIVIKLGCETNQLRNKNQKQRNR